MRSLLFQNNDQMPRLGLGTWKSTPNEVYHAIREAIRIGYRHIDCAAIYANEAEIGQAISDALTDGDVRRKELWITSKLWCNRHGKANVRGALEQSLGDLKLEYIDLYLVHWPIAIKPDIIFPEKGEDMRDIREVPLAETWQGMEEMVNEGLSRHLGVSNFSIVKLRSLSSLAAIKPEMNQIEMHPFLQQNEMLDYCKGEGIHLTAYSPLGSMDRVVMLKAPNEPSLLEHPLIMDIASKYQASSAQILIQWAINRGTSVIPKSTNPKRLKENFDAQYIQLSESDMNLVAGLDQHYRYVNGQFWAMEGSPYSMSYIWDE